MHSQTQERARVAELIMWAAVAAVSETLAADLQLFELQSQLLPFCHTVIWHTGSEGHMHGDVCMTLCHLADPTALEL